MTLNGCWLTHDIRAPYSENHTALDWQKQFARGVLKIYVQPTESDGQRDTCIRGVRQPYV